MKRSLTRLGFSVLLLLLTVVGVSAQSIQVSGTVIDETGEPMIGVPVRVQGTGIGAQTDLDGRFSFKADKKATLEASFMGYKTQLIPLSSAKLPLSIRMEPEAAQLNEVVVIGYGSVKKKDLTGSVTTISDKSFQKGAISTPDQLISGKVAGVQIMANSGAPGSGSRIRIRGGASLNASNDPLIVIDGVPVDNNNINGAPSILSSINPESIESMNVLKDASATAIYGSRASNGVILITTKQGKLGQKMSINFSTQASISTPSRYVDVLNASEVRKLIEGSTASNKASYLALLGNANTDWQREIYRTAFGTDNNLSLSGSLAALPYRLSIGYYDQNGILREDNMKRTSVSLNLSPRLLNNDLKFNINVMGSNTRNKYADRGAIPDAISFDPTQSVFNNAPTYDPFHHYFTWMAGGVPQNIAPYNPMARLNSKEDKSSVYTSIGSIKTDYILPFLRELKLSLNLGYDYASSTGTIYVPTWAPQSYTNQEAGKGGLDNHYKVQRLNKILEFYGEYAKYFEQIKSNINLMAGYSYQDWKSTIYSYPERTAGGIEYNKPNHDVDYPQNTLISFYGRLNYTLLDKYLLTATLRTDGSSRFSKKNRWGIFPSMALAWKVKEESFLKEVKEISDLKLRFGYGITGQQDGIANYSYLSFYNLSGAQSLYQLGDKFYHMYKPAAYDEDIKWEQTATTNFGVDLGLFDDRLTASVDVYYKKTKDLLNVIPVPAGSNFSNKILTNVGNVENQGIEVTLGATPIETKDWQWTLSANMTYNKTEITKLNATEDPNFLGVPTGNIEGLTGGNIQINSVGHAPNTFFVYEQVYENGKPVEGKYVDRNKDGVINENDKYYFHTPEPKVFLGFSTTLSYKNFTLSTALRSGLGGYVYDNISARFGNFSGLMNPSGFVQNLSRDYYNTEFKVGQYESDYYVHNASFLKMDNLTLSYDFGRVWQNRLGLQLSATVQNVFTLTGYKGIDPEVVGGIDYNLYPNPRIYSLKLNVSF